MLLVMTLVLLLVLAFFAWRIVDGSPGIYVLIERVFGGWMADACKRWVREAVFRWNIRVTIHEHQGPHIKRRRFLLLAVVSMIPLTYASVEFTNAQWLSKCIGLWLPAAVVYGLAVRNPVLAVVSGVLMELVAAALMEPHFYSWSIAGLVGPMFIYQSIKRLGISTIEPGRRDVAQIRMVFFAGAFVTALVGASCQVVEARIFGVDACGTPLGIFARWLVSDGLVAWQFGYWVFEYQRRLEVAE